jgi:hypothetical protein
MMFCKIPLVLCHYFSFYLLGPRKPREATAHAVGTNVPFAQLKPRSGFKAFVALKQTTVGRVKLSGTTSILMKLKFLQLLLVLHSTMTTSVCLRFGNPTLYQQGSDAQEPSPGLNWLIDPVKFTQVKSCIFTVLLLGREVTAPFSSCVWVLPWL